MKTGSLPPYVQQPNDDTHLSTEDRAKLRSVAQQFEGVFLNQMVNAMRKTIQPGGLTPPSQAERVYQGMLDTQHAEHMAESNQLGMSDLIYEHLLRSSGGR